MRNHFDTQLSRSFQKIKVHSYPDAVLIQPMLSPSQLISAKNHYLDALLEGCFALDLQHGKNRLFLRNDAYGIQLLNEWKSIVEGAIGRDLVGCYSFVSYYRRGSHLQRHLDKAECQYTLGTVLFASDEGCDQHSYLFLGDLERLTHLQVATGDGAIFEGSVTPHWRAPLSKEFLCTLLLHYRAK